ncbi:MAG: EpsD family peptidyl-prolyl cis-trans isomerase [Pseudomonadota bacterium]
MCISKRALGIALSTTLLVSACSREPSTDGQVVAKVNGSEISVHQVQALMQRLPPASAQQGDEASVQVLKNLVEQELAAQAAKAQKLDSSPKVLQAMELAKREVLAREYQDHLADNAVPPDSSDIDRYYNEHPELFKQRRQYTILETTVVIGGAQAQALRDQIKATKTTAEFQDVMRLSGMRFVSREMVQWAENLPMDLLRQFAAIEAGHSLVLERADGLVIGTLVRSELAPVERRDAQAPIQSVLTNVRRREAVEKGMQALRASGKVAFFGRFAQAASSPQGRRPASVASAASPAQ